MTNLKLTTQPSWNAVAALSESGTFIHSENNYSNLFLLKVVLQTTQSWGVLNFSDTAFEFFFAHLSKFYNLVVRLFDLLCHDM